MNHLRRIREAKVVNFSQYHLAALTGIDQKRISLLERSLVEPKPEEKDQIANALGLAVEEIWPEEASDE